VEKLQSQVGMLFDELVSVHVCVVGGGWQVTNIEILAGQFTGQY